MQLHNLRFMLVKLQENKLTRNLIRLFTDAKFRKDFLGRGAFSYGYCPVCEQRTFFAHLGAEARLSDRCVRCGSLPRWRAVIHTLQNQYPNWRNLHIHESSPYGAASDKLERECQYYLGSHYMPNVKWGDYKGKYRSEDISHQTFGSAVFDLVISLDVFEHVLHPIDGFIEIERTLKVGGAHVFTVPWHSWQKTQTRVIEQNGALKHLLPAEYHGNPIDDSGSLVITDWGSDMTEIIEQHTGMKTEIFRFNNKRLGMSAAFNEVFVSRK
jgi:hypothetical protein